jgi:hypothetical protein
MLKKLAGESECDHESRVSKYMLTCDSKTFSNIASLIDPESQQELGFFNLYNEVSEERLSKNENKMNCNIF